VPLADIYGVVKGVETTALKRSVERDLSEGGASPSSDRSADRCADRYAERSQACFSLLTPKRTLDFEVANPWLTLLIVRAMRLFLGAHFDTIAPARFFSPVCLIPATASPRAARAARAARSHSIVWTAGDVNSKLLPKVIQLPLCIQSTFSNDTSSIVAVYVRCACT
jgi:hypothetical protein